jgi:hypothetical protein
VIIWTLLMALVLPDHTDGPGRAFFRANTAPLAVFQIDFHFDAGLDDPFRAVKPAEKACRFVFHGRDAFFAVNDRAETPPVACFSGLADGNGAHGRDIIVLPFFHKNAP